jgi:hypothetical protein
LLKTVFSLDCGATNWMLYRAEYQIANIGEQIVGEPRPAPLASFVDRRLPNAITLYGSGTALECFGVIAQQQLPPGLDGGPGDIYDDLPSRLAILRQ